MCSVSFSLASRDTSSKFVIARLRRAAITQVAASRAVRSSTPVLVHAGVAAQIGLLLHVEGRLDVRLLAERQHIDERVCLGGFARDGIDQALAQRRPRPVDLVKTAHFVLDALNRIIGDGPLPVVSAELGVAAQRLAAAPACAFVFVVQKPQVDADACRLLVDVVPPGSLNTLSRTCFSG